MYEPILTQVPDGKVAALPQPMPLAYIYLALMVGIVPVSLWALVNAVLLRSAWLVATALGVGLMGFVAPLGVLLALRPTGLPVSLVFLVMRIVSVFLGVVLQRQFEDANRGHVHLGGASIDLMVLIVGAFALQFLVPFDIRLWLDIPLLQLLWSVAE